MNQHTVILPWPPTVNHYRTPMVIKGSARLILSKAGREYQKRTHLLWRAAGNPTLSGRLAATFTMYPPDRRARDLDNLLKAMLDALVHGAAFEDDSQIDDLRVVRGKVDPGNPRVEVTVVVTREPQQLTMGGAA